jgi:hypothetical protein
MFMNCVNIAENRIDREYDAAVKADDKEGVRKAMDKYASLNAILGEILVAIKEIKNKGEN